MDDYDDTGEAPLLARVFRYVTMVGATGLVFASGMASGMLVDGTSETIQAYRATVVERPRATRPSTRISYVPSGPEQPAIRPVTAAWFPAHNSVSWNVSLAPGQSMSGLSVRNAYADRNLVVILNAVGTDGRWIRAGVVNVAAGREAAVHPPTGSYAMTVIQLPVAMAYSDMDRAPASPAVYFDLTDAETADSTPATRFQVADGRVDRLPDLATYASREAEQDDDA